MHRGTEVPVSGLEERDRMVREQIEARGIREPRVLDALRRVPRHEFVPEEFLLEAYEDHPVAIGAGQTISQPYIVARMTDLAEVRPDDRVLEVGTGSGYQAAVLAEIGARVFTIERLAEHSEHARGLLESLGYDSIRYRVGDGTLGWPEEAPYDRNLVTAAGPGVPPALIDQLAEDGVLVMPVGSEHAQELVRARRRGGAIESERLGRCAFVKLIGRQGFGSSPSDPAG